MLDLMSKRVYDIAGITPKSVGVTLNGKKIVNAKDFGSYMDMFINSPSLEWPEGFRNEDAKGKAIVPKISEQCGSRWEVIVTASDG